MSEMTIEEQLEFLAKHKKLTKLRLLQELLESNRLLKDDAKKIFELGEQLKIATSKNQYV